MMKSWLVSAPPADAVEQADFVAVGEVAIEVAGHRNAVDLEARRLLGNEVGHAVAVEIEHPAEHAQDVAVGGDLIEVAILHAADSVWDSGGTGSQRRARRDELAGERGVAGRAEAEHDVAIDGVVVLPLGIEQEVAVDVDVHADAGVDAQLRPAIDREAGDEIPAGHAVAAGDA